MANEVLSSPAITLPRASTDGSAPRPGVVGTIREAIELLARNPKLMIQTMLLIFSPFSFLVLLHYVLAGPLMEKVEDGYERSELDPCDLRSFVGIESVFLLSSSIIFFLGMLLIVYGSAVIYNNKSISLKQLVSRIKFTWKKPFITWFFVCILAILYWALALVIVRWVNLYVWSWTAGILAVSLYLFLAALWSLGLVVSVLEDDVSGPKAFLRALKLMRCKKMEAFRLMSMLELMSIPIYIVFYVTSADDDDKLGIVAQFAFGAAATLLFCTAKFFSFMVFTVFYYECRRNHGEKIDLELGQGYKMVPTVAQ
ncbi:uncharacterized protein LOC115689084 [Syzygium oleosum]|uniref:uncharacterized protein LOC115689084 n=1 Tax=Syzygium oleosum TaxID=219896 RepID=UPI0011D1D205|nr:uncharacterized protein LOC115689084 [Syzygium oleosum]